MACIHTYITHIYMYIYMCVNENRICMYTYTHMSHAFTSIQSHRVEGSKANLFQSHPFLRTMKDMRLKLWLQILCFRLLISMPPRRMAGFKIAGAAQKLLKLGRLSSLLGLSLQATLQSRSPNPQPAVGRWPQPAT